MIKQTIDASYDLFELSSLLNGLTGDEFVQLKAHSRVICVEAGQSVIKEGASCNTLYFVAEGQMRIEKKAQSKKTGEIHQHVLALIGPSSFFGEMALIEGGPRSASVVAITEAVLIELDIASIKDDAAIYQLLSANIAKDLAGRLRKSTSDTTEGLERELDETKTRLGLGLFTVSALWQLGLYAWSLFGLVALKQYTADSLFVSVPVILLLGTMCFYTMIKTEFPLTYFGFNFRHWQKTVRDALLYTLPLLVLLLVVKFIVITSDPDLSHLSLIDPSLLQSTHRQQTWALYFLMLISYIFVTLIQEYIARGVFQSSLYYFLPGSRLKRRWNAIILSNLLFAGAHLHLSFIFAIFVFLPGLFWGWLYDKQRSLLGVCVSHLLTGIWAIFIVGLPSTWFNSI